MKKYIKALLLITAVAAIFATLALSASAATSGDFTYSVSDEKAEITDYTGSATSLIIPETLGGYPVTSIGGWAFYGCSSLTGITIPDSVTSIGEYAFCGCSNLTSITISDSVTSIGEYAFSACSSMTSITISDSVTSIGGYAFRYCSSLGKIDVDENNFVYCSVDGVLLNEEKTELIRYPAGKQGNSYEVPSSVTSIGADAFCGCSNLESITIPDSVTSIGEYALYGCSSLTSVTIPDSVTSIGRSAFRDCSSLTSVTIPDSVTSIGWGAFEDCTGLEYIDIGDGVTDANGKFDGCVNVQTLIIGDGIESLRDFGDYGWMSNTFPNLRKIVIGDGVNHIDGEFSDIESLRTVIIGKGVEYISYNSWDFCNNLEYIEIAADNPNYCSVEGVVFNKEKTELIKYPAKKRGNSYVIPSSVTTIEGDAFRDCNSLTSVTIPDSVTSVGWGAFYGCTSLASITIPDGVTTIEDYMFCDCTGLTSITIPSSVTSIGGSVFSGCNNLECITVAEDNPDYCLVDGVLFNKEKTELIKYPAKKQGSNYTIPSSVTCIGKSAFYGCSSLAGITIPDGVTSIGNYAFYGCSSLTSITIPDSVTTIGDWAFRNCTSLADITIPDSVTSIGEYTFYYCKSLTQLVIPASVTEIGEAAFGQCRNLEHIEVSENNPNYCSVDNVLFNKDKTALLFYSAKKTDTVYTVPSEVKALAEEAFLDADNLVTLVFGDALESLDVWAVSSCSKLTDIKVPEKNPNFASVDGVLLNKDKTRLYCYPANKSDKEYRIPSTVTSTKNFAFSRCKNLEKLIIPKGLTELSERTFCGGGDIKTIEVDAENPSYTSVDGVLFDKSKRTIIKFPAKKRDTVYTLAEGITTIGFGAFWDCTNLTNVIIPDSVTSIGDFAFSGCSNLTIYGYPGSMAEVYANEYSIPFAELSGESAIIPGDISGDGKMTARDVTALRKYIVGGYDNNKVVEAALDVNRDGKVSPRDVTHLRKAIVGGYEITLK